MFPCSFLNVVAVIVLFLVPRATALYNDIQLSKSFGESTRGDAFSDISKVTLATRLSAVTLRGNERVDQVTLRTSSPIEQTWTHGGSGGTEDTLLLTSNEYITSIEVHMEDTLFRRERVVYLKLSTNLGHSIAKGSTTKDATIVPAPEGFHLSGFFGRAAGEVFNIGAIWTRINATYLNLTDDMGTEWYGKKIRNWVGPTIGDALDSACYRKVQPLSSDNRCPRGYTKTAINCIVECPLAYPVQCHLECIPQNDDCLIEIAQKAVSVVAVFFNAATVGLFGEVKAAYKSAHRTYLCAAGMVSVLKSLIYYLRFRKMTDPDGTVEELLAVAYQSDVVLVDLPIAVCTCLGLPVAYKVRVAGVVIVIVENVIKQAIINGDLVLSSATNVIAFLTNSSLISSTNAKVMAEFQDFLDSNSTCGYQIKRITDRVSNFVHNIRKKISGITNADIRVMVSDSPLVQNTVPVVTNNCMHEVLGDKTIEAAFQTRDLLRKTMGVIIDQLIETNTTDMGASVAKDETMVGSLNLGLVVLSGLDITGILWMASQFVQPTCGPTSFIGDIDDGTLFDALGLTTKNGVFIGSYGDWTKKGDGMVVLHFASSDTKDVKVIIHSGGARVAVVKVPSHSSLTWSATIAQLQDKTLYIDRWRNNMVGIPGSSGGSLLLWVPRSSQGGHLDLKVHINST
uniref:Jacalin-type lectin domain-containing protein n=1 Tax=Hyaloperonospora arabidopsidis (strain Emoy2) TaxID=559515 RepID=M4B4I3_HYAAE